MNATAIINAGIEAMDEFRLDTSGITSLPSESDMAQAILDAIEGESEDFELIELLNSLVK